MSLVNMNPMQGGSPMPPQDPLKPVATRMQTDENARGMIAQFFSDPGSRQFVHDSGNIQSAITRPDNPWGLPGVGPTADPEHSVLPPVSPPAALGGPAAPTAQPQTYATAHDYAQAHPDQVSMSARPVAPMDNMSTKQQVLQRIFLALNQFGAGLNHHENSYASQFWGRQMDAEAAQRQYDQTLPTMKNTAENAAYDKYLGHETAKSGIENTQSEINYRNKMVPPQQLELQQRNREFMNKAIETWTKDPRYLGNPKSFLRALQAESQGLQIDPEAIKSVMAMPQVSNKYSVEFSKDGGVPAGLTTATGQHISPADIAGLNDPMASKMWTDSQAAYKTGQTDRMSIAKETATFRGAAMNNGRPQKVTNTKTGLSKTVPASEAYALTGDPNSGWVSDSPADVQKSKGRWASFGDVMDTANRLHGSLQNLAPQDMAAIGEMGSALAEHHGVLDTAVSAKLQSQLSPAGQQVAADMLAVRDNIQNLISAQNMQMSDTRVQSLWNAMPTATDLQSPALLNRKMQNLYRMIQNLQPGLPGTADQFGVPEHEAPAGSSGNKTDLTKVQDGTVSASGAFVWNTAQNKWVPNSTRNPGSHSK